jgi:hypothetical protein
MPAKVCTNQFDAFVARGLSCSLSAGYIHDVHFIQTVHGIVSGCVELHSNVSLHTPALAGMPCGFKLLTPRRLRIRNLVVQDVLRAIRDFLEVWN